MPDNPKNLSISAYYKTNDALYPVYISVNSGEGLSLSYDKKMLQYSLMPNEGIIKGWVKFNNLGIMQDSYNVKSVVKNNTGNFTINWVNPFLKDNYCIQVSAFSKSPIDHSVIEQSSLGCTVMYTGGSMNILGSLVVLSGSIDPLFGYVLAIGNR